MKSNNFKIGGGRTIENRKSNWPDCLHLTMNRGDAWEMVHNLMNQLSDEQRTEMRYSSCGKLETNTEE